MSRRRRIDPDTRALRIAAREEILKAATAHRRQRYVDQLGVAHYVPQVYEMRHLQQAVKVCRAHKLVSHRLLERAGFKAPRSGPDKATRARYARGRAARHEARTG